MIATSRRNVLLRVAVRISVQNGVRFWVLANWNPGSRQAKNHQNDIGIKSAATSIETQRMPSTSLPPAPLKTARLASANSQGVPIANKFPRKLFALNSRVRSW